MTRPPASRAARTSRSCAKKPPKRRQRWPPRPSSNRRPSYQCAREGDERAPEEPAPEIRPDPNLSVRDIVPLDAAALRLAPRRRRPRCAAGIGSYCRCGFGAGAGERPAAAAVVARLGLPRFAVFCGPPGVRPAGRAHASAVLWAASPPPARPRALPRASRPACPAPGTAACACTLRRGGFLGLPSPGSARRPGLLGTRRRGVLAFLCTAPAPAFRRPRPLPKAHIWPPPPPLRGSTCKCSLRNDANSESAPAIGQPSRRFVADPAIADKMCAGVLPSSILTWA